MSLEIDVIRGENIKVAYKSKKGLISYKDKIHFFRALGLFIENMKICERTNEYYEFDISEDIIFYKNGVMFDVSRNAVLKPEAIKFFLRKMALMGLNLGMLYTEDTYKVNEWPYFGYMRGRYDFEELKELDDYAYIFGIELMPCIQTLAHLSTALRWKDMAELKDTNDVLLVGSEKVYKFIEDMIAAASKPYRSKRIHIGMDEAMDLGLGKYLRINGYKSGFDLMQEHTRRVSDILEKHGLEAMMWGDMYFRFGTKTRSYYDLESAIPEDVKKSAPKNIGLVYGDYYHFDEEFYLEFIKRHQEFNNKVIFAGAVWTWSSIPPNYIRTFETTNPALNACKKAGIKEIICTIWPGVGSECNMLTSLLGLQLYSEHGYTKELDINKLEKRFKFCVGIDADAFFDLGLLDILPGTKPEGKDHSNPSSYLLYQDPLLGLFDKDIEGFDFKEYYASIKSKYEIYAKQNKEFKLLFTFYEKLAYVLELKSELGKNITNSYKEKDKKELENIAYNIIPNLILRVEVLRKVWRELWFSTNKPFGFEVIDIRVGGIEVRLKSTKDRLDDYLKGRCEIIEELEEERLLNIRVPGTRQLGGGVRWPKLVTAGRIV
jgi:hexosaminidase